MPHALRDNQPESVRFIGRANAKPGNAHATLGFNVCSHRLGRYLTGQVEPGWRLAEQRRVLNWSARAYQR